MTKTAKTRRHRRRAAACGQDLALPVGQRHRMVGDASSHLVPHQRHHHVVIRRQFLQRRFVGGDLAAGHRPPLAARIPRIARMEAPPRRVSRDSPGPCSSPSFAWASRPLSLVGRRGWPNRYTLIKVPRTYPPTTLPASCPKISQNYYISFGMFAGTAWRSRRVPARVRHRCTRVARSRHVGGVEERNASPNPPNRA
jgi:hypothetical protein